jgi:hypothetical protein
MRTALCRALCAAAVPPVILLSACGGGDESDTAASSTPPESSVSESSEPEEPQPDLASGLLPASAFGPQASVVAVTAEQLQRGAGLAAASAENLQVSPKDCSAAVAGTQPDFDDFGDVAAEAATVGSAVTVEVLVRGGPIEDAVDQLTAAAERCPTAQISSPEIGQATLTFEALPVDDLGDGAALLRYTTALTLPDGTQATVPALIGAVQDGDRLLIMTSLDAGAAAPGGATGAPAAPPDPAAFAALLAQAYEVQADALG